jgi:cytochrome c-type biogenesis protein CcmH/NrfG
MAQGETRSARVQRMLQEAACLHRDGRFGDAERRYRTAVRLHPDNLTALFSLGTLLAAMNRADEAVKFLERALATNPPDPHTRAQLEGALARVRLAHAAAHP